MGKAAFCGTGSMVARCIGGCRRLARHAAGAMRPLRAQQLLHQGVLRAAECMEAPRQRESRARGARLSALLLLSCREVGSLPCVMMRHLMQGCGCVYVCVLKQEAMSSRQLCCVATAAI